MTGQDRELEVKFYLSDLAGLEARLQAAGGQLRQARTHEVNLRFDTPDGELERAHRVLRLRREAQAYLTYKGPSETLEGVWSRPEIEVQVGDFDTTRALFEALGYQVRVIYEKYRTTYQLGDVQVTLDEMPYGDFVELEGPDARSIAAAAARLGLDWEARLLTSYLILFERARQALGFGFRDLTFENFRDLRVPAAILAARPGDLPGWREEEHHAG